MYKSTIEGFEFKNRYIQFYQFEIFGIKAAENKENNKKILFIITSKIFLVIQGGPKRTERHTSGNRDIK